YEPSWSLSFLRNRALTDLAPNAGPANVGRLRPANIQAFEILQWRSLPTRWESGYHTSNALTISPARPPKRPFAASLRPVSGSNHGHSSVHVNCLAGHIAGFIGGEIDSRRSNVLRRAKPCCRNLR